MSDFLSCSVCISRRPPQAGVSPQGGQMYFLISLEGSSDLANIDKAKMMTMMMMIDDDFLFWIRELGFVHARQALYSKASTAQFPEETDAAPRLSRKGTTMVNWWWTPCVWEREVGDGEGLFVHCEISDTGVAGNRCTSSAVERLHDSFVQWTPVFTISPVQCCRETTWSVECILVCTPSPVICSYLSRVLGTPTDHMMREKSHWFIPMVHVYIASSQKV